MKFAALVERVDSDARSLKPGRVVLSIVMAVLFALGWVVGAVFRGVWLVVAWAWAAAVVGFKVASGRGS